MSADACTFWRQVISELCAVTTIDDLRDQPIRMRTEVLIQTRVDKL